MGLPFVPCVNTAQVTLAYTQADGSPAINTLWFRGSSSYTASKLSDLADGLAAWWNDGTGSGADVGLKSITSHTVSLVSVTARDMATQHGHVVVWTAGLPIVGAVSGDAVELGLTYATTFRTGLAGVAYRGRNYMVGVPTSSVSDPGQNIVDTALSTALDVAYGGLITYVPTIGSNSDAHAVASRYHMVGGVLTARDAGIVTPVLSYGHANQYLDFQRRRAPGHNRHR